MSQHLIGGKPLRRPRTDHARRLCVLLMVSCMLANLPSGLAEVGNGPSRSVGSRSTITTFETGFVNRTYTYNTDQVVKTSYFTLPNNARVDEASLHVNPLPRNPGTKAYPNKPQVDVGDDGQLDWTFDHQGFGGFGYQSVIYNDSTYSSLDLKANVRDNSTTLRLPLKANVTSATLNVEGRFRFSQLFTVEGHEAGEYLGERVSFVGDLNGDGWQDFAVGSPWNDSNLLTDNGRVLVFFGGAKVNTTADLVFNGSTDGEQFGYNVAPAGDVNKDGYGDLLVGSPMYYGVGSQSGRAFLYYGAKHMKTTPDLTMDGEGPSDWFGITGIGVGDLNKDGYADFVLSAPNHRLPPSDEIFGRIYVYLGSASPTTVPNLKIDGPTFASYWAKAIAPAGDVNGDTYADFLVGTESSDASCTKCGRVDLFYGGATVSSSIGLTIYGTGGEGLGYAVAPLGDLNKDGNGDFIASALRNAANGPGTGAAYVYFGGKPPDKNADLKMYGTGGGDYFGSSLTTLGDINKDGWLDFAVSAEMNLSGNANTGAVLIFFGAPVLHNVSDEKVQGTADSDVFGHSISGGYDLDVDGYPDLIVGAYMNDSKAKEGGKAYIYTTVPKRAVDPLLEVDGLPAVQGHIWNATGIYIGNRTVADFSKALRTYLASAKATGTDNFGNVYVDIRLAVSSKGDAEILLSNISIIYDYDAVIDVEPNGGSLHKVLDGKIPHTDTGTTKVTLWGRSMSAGKLFFHDLRIVTDDAPITIKVPDLSLKKNSIVPHLIDLYKYFNDSNDPQDYLKFYVVSFTNKQYVNVTINQSHFLSVDSDTGLLSDNWTGMTVVQLKATDTRNLSKLSNKFNVTITPVDLPPVFLSRPVLDGMVGIQYSYQAKAVDDDNAVSYQLVASPQGMSVNQTTGLIQWVPASIGDFPVHLMVFDGKWDIFQNYSIHVVPQNHPPAITSKPLTTATVGVLYTYKFAASDIDGNNLTARLAQAPMNMTMNDSWVVTFIPAIDQVGDQTVDLEVSDGKFHVWQNYTLTVSSTGMNHVPRFTSTPPTTGKVGWAFTYNMKAVDEDNDGLTFSLDRAPTGMALRGTARADWVPTADQVGSHDVVARVSDGKAYSLQRFTVNITQGAANHPPVITSTPPLKAMVGHTYQYQVTAHDDDLDPITLSIDTPKVRIQIDPATGLLIWHPTSGEAGNQTLSVRASDGKGFGTQAFTVLVEPGDNNGLPIFLTKPVTEAKVGVAYSYEPKAMDPESDVITYTLALKQDGMTVVPTTGAIHWTPVNGQEGNVTVELRASDGKGFTAQRFVINVRPADLVQNFTVKITNPTSKAKVSGNLSVQGTAAVALGRLYEVQVSVDGGKWQTAQGLETWNFTLDTKTLGNGNHRISVQAWDGSLYSTPVSVDFVIENKAKPTPPNPDTIFGLSTGLCVLGLIVLIVVLIGIVMVFKKSSTQPPRPPPQRPRRDERYPPRERRGPPPERPEDRYDRDYYRDKGPGDDYGASYEEGHDQGYDEQHDQDQPNDEGYDQGNDDQGYEDGDGPSRNF